MGHVKVKLSFNEIEIKCWKNTYYLHLIVLFWLYKKINMA